MNLVHNELTNIAEFVFGTLSKLETLNLNSNSITSLFTCAFCGLDELTLLNLMNSNIIFVDRGIFGDTKMHVIITDDFQVCCM